MPAKKPRFRSHFHNPLHIHNRRQLRQHRRWSRKTLLLWFGRAAIVGGIFSVLLFAWYAKDLPTPQGIRHRLGSEETTKIYDRTGQHLLYAISGQQRRVSIALSAMPDNVKEAVIAIEDKDFYKHHGIDFRGLARAVVRDVTSGSKAQGGSTITQQLVRNAIIGSNRKSWGRKIKEAILSVEIEAMYPKDKILELYLNEIPFGANAYGVEAASETFFGKKSSELTLEEAATLAALPKGPSHYSPYGAHVKDLVNRRNLILALMAKEGYVTEAEARAAQSQKLVTIARHDTILAPHFVMYVRDIIAEKYGEDIFSQGLSVTTTLDIEQQKAAERAVADGAVQNKQRFNIQNAGLVALNPKTGEVLAMVGSADYFDNAINGQFNVTTAERQPGSAFKPIVYAAALKQKFNPAFVLWDLPTDFNGYKPSNFDGRSRGPVTMREAIGQSLNLPAVKILALVGSREALRTASDLGITTLDSPEKYGLSLVLGAAEVRPIELAQAYGVFANRGVRQDIYPILKIDDKSGKTLEALKPEDHDKSVLDPQIAYEMSNILADQVAKAPVFGSLLSFSGRDVASKTGTTNGINGSGQTDVRDAWTVGYVPSLVTAIWVGNNDHSPLGKGVLAANAAVPIYKEYMNAVLPSLPNEPFVAPAGIQTITVDKLSNRLPGDASPPDQAITDIFSSWQAPAEKDNIHVKVKLCQGTNQLATDETPANQTEEKYFVAIHSERPNDPAWEGPVQAWADANGYTNRPPSDKCDTFTQANRPSVAITKPTNGATVSDGFDIEAAAGSQFGVNEVDFLIDNQLINVDQGAPYTSRYETKNLTNGSHTLTATAKDSFGRTNSASINLVVTKESTPPSDVKSVNAAPARGQVTLTWSNPTDADLSRIRIYIAETAGDLGLRYSSEPAAVPGSVSNTTISGLTSGKSYFFVIRPVDTNNNENQSTFQYSATIP